MSELVQNPQELAGQMADEAAATREKRAVYDFVDVADPQSMADFNAYLEARPFQDTAGRLRRPDGKMAKQDYFEQAHEDIYNESMDQPYEELSMSELADELADAEVQGDTTKAGDVSDVLIDKMHVFAQENSMDEDAQTNLFNRVMRLKDNKKQQYLEIEAQKRADSSESVQSNEVNEASAESQEAEAAGEFEHPEHERAADEYVELMNRYRQLGAQLEEQDPNSDEAERLRNETRQLRQEMAQKKSEIFSMVAHDLAADAFKARAQGDDERADVFAEKARAYLEDYIQHNNIEEEPAEEMRRNLQSRIDDGETPVFPDGQPPRPSDESRESGEVRSNEAATDGETGGEAPSREQQEKTFRDRVRALRKAGKALRKDENGKRDLRGALNGAKEAFARNAKDASPEESAVAEEETTERKRKLNLSRRMIGAGALALAALAGGVAGYAAADKESHDDIPAYIEQDIEADNELRDAGVEDEEARQQIIDNPEAFERMANNPGEFNRMMVWRQGEIEHRVKEGQARNQAEQAVDHQLNEYFEDLDDNEAA